MFFTLILAFLSLSFAENKNPILLPSPSTPQIGVPGSGKVEYGCGEIIAALQDYNDIARAHERAIVSFVGDVSEIMTSWHQTLSPLENSRTLLPKGTFDPIQKGVDEIDPLMGMIEENSQQLNFRVQSLLSSLEKCL